MQGGEFLAHKRKRRQAQAPAPEGKAVERSVIENAEPAARDERGHVAAGEAEVVSVSNTPSAIRPGL